ncbi:MAG: 4a-hydroxytetrahydrobiopterin dehydratase [Gammaproteobacteria bacterium]
MSALKEQQCKPCEGGVAPLSQTQARDMMSQIHADWALSGDGKSIQREFTFTNFYRTMGFVNAIAFIANAEGHHPDLEVGYGRCHVTWTTHAIDGLSDNDFICAAKMDAL